MHVNLHMGLFRRKCHGSNADPQPPAETVEPLPPGVAGTMAFHRTGSARTGITIALISIMLILAACNRQSDSQATPIPAAVAVTDTPVATTAPQEPVLAVVADTPTPEPTATTVPQEPILVPTPATDAEPAPLAQPRGRVNALLVNVRAAPEMNGPLLATAAEGAEFDVLGRTADGRWTQVCCVDGATGDQWINTEFLDVDQAQLADIPPAPTTAEAEADAAPAPAGGKPSAVIAVTLANVRGGPNTTYPVVAEARAGQTLNIIGRNAAGDWLQVCCLTADPQQQTWLSTEIVDVSGDIQTVAEVAAPEPPPAPVAAAPSGTGGAAAIAAAPAPGLPGPGGFGAPGGTNPFTGQPLAGDVAGRRPVIVCINNDFAARPQFGTSQADIMYEYLMEGFGITRFSGIFYGDNVAQIGPVRSARLVNYYLGALYDAGLLCSGASDQVRFTLKHEAPFPYLDIDLDDPSNARYSVSVGSDYRTRLRTATDKFTRWLTDWGVQQPAAVRGFSFGGLPGGGVPATSIGIPYPSATGSNVAYSYAADSGRYLRSLGGAPHLDGNSGAQVGVENVIVQFVPHQVTDIVEDSLGSLSIRLNLFGSGRAIVFRDGQAFEGTWQSNSRGDIPRFVDGAGNEIPLKPGRSWISIVPTDYTVTYQ